MGPPTDSAYAVLPVAVGDDDAVTAVVGDTDTVDVDRELDGPTESGATDDDFVQGVEAVACAGHRWPRAERALRSGLPRPVPQSRRSRDLETFELGQKAEAAHVHAQNQGLGLDRQAGATQDGAIAAEAHHEVAGREPGRGRAPAKGRSSRSRGPAPRCRVLLPAQGLGPRATCGLKAMPMRLGAAALALTATPRSTARRYRKNSRLPAGPRRGDAVRPKSRRRCPAHQAMTRPRMAACTAGSLTTPFFRPHRGAPGIAASRARRPRRRAERLRSPVAPSRGQ